MRLALVTLISLVAAGALAEEPVDVPPPRSLVVGRPVDYRPPGMPVSVICDDVTIVRVEDGGTFLRLTGLKPGETQCSFGSPLSPGRRRLYHITVRP